MPTFANGESAASVRTKINDAIDKVDGAAAISSINVDGGTIDGVTIGGASAGAITGTTITGTSFVSSGDMTFGDNDKAIFGAGSDLQIYHDGVNSRIYDVGTGDLRLQGTNLRLLAENGETFLLAAEDGAVSLYYDNAAKLATTATGVDVTGTITSDGLTVNAAVATITNDDVDNGATLRLDNSHTSSSWGLGKVVGTLEYYLSQDGSTTEPLRAKIELEQNNTNITYPSGADLNFYTALVNTLSKNMTISSGGDISFYEDTGTTPKFFWDASTERLGIGNAAPATALDVTGTVKSDGALIEGNAYVNTNSGLDAFFITRYGNLEDQAAKFTVNDNTFTVDSIQDEQYGSFLFQSTYNGTGTANRLNINNDGDISFYEDTGTTPKFFWDASAESLGIGTSSPSAKLDVSGAINVAGDGSDVAIYMDGSDAIRNMGTGSIVYHDVAFGSASHGQFVFRSSNAATERMRIDTSGNVGIGTNAPTQRLSLFKSTSYNSDPALYMDFASGDGSVNNNRPYNWRTGITGDATGYNYTFSTLARLESSYVERMRISFGGDISFYEDTGTTPKFFWDASEERLGIGTSSPAQTLQVVTSGNTGAIAIGTSAGTGVKSLMFGDNDDYSIQSNGASYLRFHAEALERMRLDESGNLLIGGTATPTSSVGNIVLYNGTAPTGNATNGIILYAEDVSSSSELKVRDEAGNVTTLSPHNFDLIPEGPSEEMAWSYYSERDGKRINVDMLKAIRLLEQITGEKLVHMA